MKIVEQSYEILNVTARPLEAIEAAARTCYKSEEKIGPGTAKAMVANLMKRGHHAMLEVADATIRFVTDRGVSHEIVRHRLCSFAQESTRFCDYGGHDVVFIRPVFVEKDPAMLGGLSSPEAQGFELACKESERSYFALRALGLAPEHARGALNHYVKTEIVVKTNLREWRHIFALRVLGTTGRPHPHIKALMEPALREMALRVEVVFDDLVEALDNNAGTADA